MTIQRVYIVSSCIILIGLFVFLGAPDLPKTVVLGYIVGYISAVFKGFVPIALLALAISTADASLNVCAVVVGHDVAKSLPRCILYSVGLEPIYYDC